MSNPAHGKSCITSISGKLCIVKEKITQQR